MIHLLNTSIEPPERMNDPFCYEPHPLCIIAADEVRAYIRGKAEWQEEVGRGKMFGVLVVEDGQRMGYLAAYSGQIGGRSDWEGFVPAVFDYLQEDGYFKRHEAEITEINREVERLEADSRLRCLTEETAKLRRKAEEAIAAHRNLMAEAKRRRDERRRTEALTDGEQAAMTRESQFLKAELRRMKKRFAGEISRLEDETAAFRSRIDRLKQQRKERSDALQRWLFSHFEMLNARGERRNLLDIFAGTVFKVPPAGAGECCEPKLLQYAFAHGLRPLCIAMFWVGNSPRMEIRHDGHFYPACSGKCKPILEWMKNNQGLEIRGKGLEDSNIKNETDQQSISLTSYLSPLTSFILYHDPSIIVVNKSAGMLSVPGKDGRESVYSIMKRLFPDAEELMMVHRLDMATSGLLVIAKTKKVHENLQKQFISHTIKKRYIAVLSAPVKERSGIISLPLRPDIMDRPRQVVDLKHGKPAVTRYEVIDCPQTHMQRAFARKGSPLVALYPETGRTHQLRVHCAHRDGLNAPIVGDTLYGSASDRLYLHAEYLEFTHPVTGRRMRFTGGG